MRAGPNGAHVDGTEPALSALWPPPTTRIVPDRDHGQDHRTRVAPKSSSQLLYQKFAGLSPLTKLQLARQLGYGSFDQMLEASRMITLPDGSSWWLTADRYGAWAAWNLCMFEVPPAIDPTVQC
jgi:hypothetical protein